MSVDGPGSPSPSLTATSANTDFAPLRGIRVADLSKVLAGPLCTQYLSDLGATVIKVEPCYTGDDSRAWPPLKGGDSAVFLSANRNKQSLAVDLKTASGREIALRLVETADVLVESYRKGVAERLGLGYASVKKRNNRLVYASISGFGRTGPLSELPGYDLIAQAFSGIMDITGERGGGPVRSAFSPLDHTTGIWAALGILAALRHRDATGEGSYLEVSLFETAIAFLGYTAQIYWTKGDTPKRSGSSHESLCPYQAFKAADDYLLIGVGNDKLWRQFCDAVGLNDFVDDPRFRTNADRVAHFAETVALVGERISRRGVADWTEILTTAGVPNSPINSVDQVLALPHTRQCGIILDYEHPVHGPLKSVAMPVSFGGEPRTVRSAPPKLGQHTVEILRDLGFADSETENWLRQGVVHAP
ncbi:MAG: CoA transferase [Betaproteobacteria bacterium]|nr:MAG: CoA transferase [Betaproteobacteria bacterium]